ncbi:hypothetical protein XM38_025190 [Halomicronema hongdechloris C2206]|uniref:Glycosyltransferase 2-like domain-containing protein n=1 Tax=Halomicronema hongdechloris C2206 TaxID=1641165 RepID=A0A1Z3HN45_9CYAN|nr:glycosyltransferase [Halomicronema hongdechloris]ASC71567.1 hypothetical protein XM38_025190 [Halomicronema hongdechloris C2206]
MDHNLNPKISVVMIDGSFRENFSAIKYFGDQSLPSESYELIWVEYYNNVDKNLRREIEKFPNFRILTLGREGEYHSSYCFNAGISESIGDVIVIPDADLVVENNFLEEILSEHRKNNELAMYIYRLNEPKELHQEPITLEHLKQVCILTNPTNYGGCLSVRKEWLLKINGYEQHPTFGTGFHANGLDIYTRLKNLGLQIKWHPTLRLYHAWHPFTEISDHAYKLQKEIIKYRERNLLTNTFCGIDVKRNQSIPDELIERLEKIRVGKSYNSNKKLVTSFKLRDIASRFTRDLTP